MTPATILFIGGALLGAALMLAAMLLLARLLAWRADKRLAEPPHTDAYLEAEVRRALHPGPEEWR